MACRWCEYGVDDPSYVHTPLPWAPDGERVCLITNEVQESVLGLIQAVMALAERLEALEGRRKVG